MPKRTIKNIKSYFLNKSHKNKKQEPQNRIVIRASYDWRNNDQYKGFSDEMNAIRNSFDKSYVDNLIKFVNNDFTVVIKDEELKFTNDIEIEYILKFTNEGINMYHTERGQIRTYYIEQSKNINYTTAKLAIHFLKRFNDYKAHSNYSKLDSNNLNLIKQIIKKDFSEKYYSFEGHELDKINVETYDDGSLDIYYYTKDLEKKYFHKNIKEDYKYRLLYMVIEHLKEITQVIPKIEKTFQIKLSLEDKENLIMM